MTHAAPVHIADAITEIESAVALIGLPELASRSGVPYTTLIEWRDRGWRPRTVESFERVVRAATEATAASE